jgi:hypothetical protein
MKRTCISPVLLIALFVLTASAAWAGKAQVCHIPPGNPDNFHTITVSQNAVQAHLGHGDLAGACFSNCDILCSEEHPCTTGECSCRCVAEIPDFLDALNGQFGLTDCQERGAPSELVFLTTGDGRRVGFQSSISGASGCGFFFNTGPSLFLSPEEASACGGLVRQKVTAAGLTCTPF